ncbi:helix-turn-helix domain-containing protein [Halobacillus sp. H74]|uniref:helix-turn-helix domain-containing protein n=1 Tax=Halobacillus sp. H74 TaxID=3457436 RepID=UPI003FCCA33B
MIKLIRSHYGETQRMFAKRLGISTSYLEKLEIGSRIVSENVEARILARCDLTSQRIQDLKAYSKVIEA